MQRKAVLFDLDDTLVAFDAVKEASWLEVCSQYQHKSHRISSAKLYEAIQRKNDWFWNDEARHREGRQDIGSARRRIVADVFKELELPLIDAEEIADKYSSIRLQKMYLLPDVEITLQELKVRNYELALLTNGDSDIQRKKINRFGLGRHFGHVLIEGELGFGKPDRRIYLKALSDLDISPNRAWMVGDNLIWDIAGPQSLGIRGIWHDWQGQGLPENARAIPYRIIRTIGEILQICE